MVGDVQICEIPLPLADRDAAGSMAAILLGWAASSVALPSWQWWPANLHGIPPSTRLELGIINKVHPLLREKVIPQYQS